MSEFFRTTNDYGILQDLVFDTDRYDQLAALADPYFHAFVLSEKPNARIPNYWFDKLPFMEEVIEALKPPFFTDQWIITVEKPDFPVVWHTHGASHALFNYPYDVVYWSAEDPPVVEFENVGVFQPPVNESCMMFDGMVSHRTLLRQRGIYVRACGVRR